MGRRKFKIGDRVIGNKKKASFVGRKGKNTLNIKCVSMMIEPRQCILGG
jgi:hypothetical protein